jgi:hypothetical protein
MRIIETEAYTFDELSDDAKEKVIDNFRKDRYENDWYYISDLIIDDCYLLSPKGIDELIIKNTRKVYYDIYRGYIDISKAMDIKDDNAFLNWLNIPIELQNEVSYKIEERTICFEENDCEYEFTENDNEILDNAKEKFEEHCSDILQSIEKSYDFYHSDECIIEDIKCNEYEFTKEGKPI